MKTLPIIMLLLVVVLVGCTNVEDDAADISGIDTAAAQAATEGISASDLQEVENLSEDLNMDDLDGLEADLENLTW